MKGMFSILVTSRLENLFFLNGRKDVFRKNAGYLLSLMLFLINMTGCANTAPYNVMMHNSGVADFSHAVIVFGQKQISSGWVSPGNSKTSIDLTSSIPEKAIVRWRRGETNSFEKEVAVKSQLPPRATNEYYTLVFAVDEDENVQFKVVLCMRDFPCPEKYAK